MSTIRFMPTITRFCENREAIVSRLTGHLEALQARALAKSTENACGQDDLGAALLEEELSSVSEGRRRPDLWTAKEVIRRRAARIAAANIKRNGLAHLKDEYRKRVLSAPAEYRLEGPASEHQADEIAAILFDEAPWLREAIEIIWQDMRRFAREGLGLKFRPILFDGPPGIGKTHLARRLGELTAVPSLNFDVGSSSEGFRITGLARGWGTAHPSQIVERILDSGVANPVVFVDEIDKAGVRYGSNGVGTSVLTSLLVLLEPRSATAWECPFYQVPFDMAHVNWVLASNDVSRVPAPLQTRVQVVRLKGMDHKTLVQAAARRCRQEDLPDGVVEDVARLLAVYPPGHHGLNMRTLTRMFDNRAALERRLMLN